MSKENVKKDINFKVWELLPTLTVNPNVKTQMTVTTSPFTTPMTFANFFTTAPVWMLHFVPNVLQEKKTVKRPFVANLENVKEAS